MLLNKKLRNLIKAFIHIRFDLIIAEIFRLEFPYGFGIVEGDIFNLFLFWLNLQLDHTRLEFIDFGIRGIIAIFSVILILFARLFILFGFSFADIF